MAKKRKTKKAKKRSAAKSKPTRVVDVDSTGSVGSKRPIAAKGSRRGLLEKGPRDYPALTVALLVLAVGMPILTYPAGYQSFPPIRQLLLVSIAILGVLFLLYSWYKSRQISYIYSGAELPWAVLLAALLLSTIFSISFSTSLWGQFALREGFLTWCSYAAVFFLSVQAFQRRRARDWLVIALTYSSIAIVAYALLQVIGLDFLNSLIPSFNGRASSFLGNPAYLGGYLSLVAPVFLCLASDKYVVPKKRRGHMYVFAFLVIGVIATGSRAAWISVALTSALVFVYVLYRRGVRLSKAVIEASAITLLVFALVMGIGLATSKSFREKTFAIKEIGINSINIRSMTWGKTMEMVAHSPILGQGLGTYQLAFPDYVDRIWEQKIGHELPDDPHDVFLNITVSAGIIGLGVFIWLLAKVYLTGWRRFNQVEEKEQYLLGGFLLGSIGYLVNIMFHPSVMDTTTLFWLFLGLALAVPLRGDSINDKRVKAITLGKERRTWRALLWTGALSCMALFVLAFIILGRSVVADQYERDSMSYWKAYNSEAAINSARRAASSDNRYAEYRLVEARMMFNKAVDNSDAALFKDTEKMLAQLIRENLNWEAARLTLGYAYLKEFEIFKHRPRVERLPTIEGARNAFRAIVARDPYYADAQAKLARCEMYEWKYDGALARLEKVYELRPDWSEPWDVAGNCYFLKGDNQRAEECFRKAKEINKRANKTEVVK